MTIDQRPLGKVRRRKLAKVVVPTPEPMPVLRIPRQQQQPRLGSSFVVQPLQ